MRSDISEVAKTQDLRQKDKAYQNLAPHAA
jgi:hypothetical protein